MRKILLLIALCFCFVTNAQSIMGIPLGSSKSEVINQLKQRGYTAFNNGHELVVHDIQLGGIFYDAAYFSFQFYGGKSYFGGATFSQRFELSEREFAFNCLSQIVDIYKSKYANEYYDTFIDDSGIRQYQFGKHPQKKDLCKVVINLRKSKSNGGDEYFYLNVWYVDIEYVKYRDEI